MRAMVIDRIGTVEPDTNLLKFVDWPEPEPGAGQVLIQVSACGMCHTELDEIEGRTPPPRLPVVPGHQVVGRIIQVGPEVRGLSVGQRVGVGWIASTCGECQFCREGRENLCPLFQATGRDVNGGYAERMVARAQYCYPLPDGVADSLVAPLLCAGAVGFRSLRIANIQPGQVLGLAGFGASGHLVLKMVGKAVPGTRVIVFARDKAERKFALELGAAWAGDFTEQPPEPADAIIDTTPAWAPAMHALRNLKPAGRLVINAIRKEDKDKSVLLGLDYPAHLWMEKEIMSVANITRQDIHDFLFLAATSQDLLPAVEEFDLKDANLALTDLKNRRIRGAKVLKIT